MKWILKLSKIWGLSILNIGAENALPPLYAIRFRHIAAELRLSVISVRAYLPRIILSSLSIVFANAISFSQNGLITGKVRYGKETLQSATISLGNKTTLSNYHGEFSFSVKPGDYTMSITHAGYKKIERTVSVNAGETKNFDFDMIPAEQLGEVVVLGSRSAVHRSNLNTPVPVDAFSSAQLEETGQTSLMQMLSFTAPSLNTSLQNAFEPVTLRGLYPDQILILLNGTRYNNSAYLNSGNPRGQLGRGSVSNDLNSIPFSAIERVEILRDGASAQYGSDAVAGVINILLKESTGKTSVNLHLGQQYEGDGENLRLGVYRGFDLNKKGFLTVAADIRFRNPTFRGGEHQGTVYYNIPANSPTEDSLRIKLLDDSTVEARSFDRMQASNAGNSKLTSFGLLINGAYPINKKTSIFWTGAMNNASFVFVFPYTFPKIAPQVNTELFPDGFKGRVKPDNWNVSGIAGAKGVIGKEIYWEYSSAYGMNSSRFESHNTNNASQQFSLGKSAPTEFYTGTLTYQQLTNNIHFTKNLLVHGNKSKTINLHWGAELRFENFKMKAGEEASWKNYDTTHKKLGGAQASMTVSPGDELNKNRNVIGAYIDIETDLNNKFILDIAGRFENYSDFGSNVAGKLAVKYKLAEILSFRGSVSNGFRAPSMQQRYWGTIYSGFIRGGNSSTPTTLGIFNNEHQVTKVFGVPSLEPEKSLNLSAGIISNISRHISLTIDGYWIQIKNRIVLGGAFNQRNPGVDSLLNDPTLRDYENIVQVQFFSNAINTKTHGIDVVLHGKWNLHRAKLIAVASLNLTRTELFGDIKTAANLPSTPENENTLFNDEQTTHLEEGQPRNKIIVSLNYKLEKVGFMLRNTRFGETSFRNPNQPKETFSAKILTDFSVSYAPKTWLTLTAGANNIFDVYPDTIENFNSTNQGLYIYATQSSPFGHNGGYYFVSMSFNF